MTYLLLGCVIALAGAYLGIPLLFQVLGAIVIVLLVQSRD